MGKIKILHDRDGEYGIPNGTIMEDKELIADYIDCLDDVEDAETIKFLYYSKREVAVDFVAEMWGLDYEYI